MALNVVEGDMHFVGPICFWKQAKILEFEEAGKFGVPAEHGIPFQRSGDDIQLLRDSLTSVALEKSLQELLLLMEEGLIVIGKGDSGEKTSFGHKARKVPMGTIYDAIQSARDDFAKDKDDICQWSWMVQATTKGWDWANCQIAEMDNAEYHRERDDFFRELS